MKSDRVRRIASQHLQGVNTPTVTGLIVAVNPDTESITVDIGSSVVQVTHPFVSGNAWIRAVPGTGTSCTLSYNQSKSRYEFVAYAPSQEYATKQLELYQKKRSLYRQLQEGELELASSGGVTEHYGSRPVLNGRAGAVSWAYDSDKLEASTTAPTHIKRGHRSFQDQIKNETRFGVVKRPLSGTREMYALTAPLSNPIAGIYTYAYEYLINLCNDNDAPLFDHRIGEVYDDALTPGIPFATPALSKKFNLPLRARYRYYSTIEPGGMPASGKLTSVEISCLGDVDVSLSDLAVQGFNMSIPYGAFTMKAGLQSSFISRLAVLVKSEIDKIALEAGRGIVLNAGTDVKSTSGTSHALTAGTSFAVKAGTSVDVSGVTIKVDGKGLVSIHGALGLTLSGAMGSTGRIINTLQNDVITGIPTFIDPTLHS